MDVSSLLQNLLLWFHGYTLKALHPLYRNCIAQLGIASEEVLGPDVHSLLPPSWFWLHSALLRDLWCSSKGPVIKPSTRQSDLQQIREDVEKGRLFSDQYSIEMLCSPKCNASCQPLQILHFCKNNNTLHVLMQGVGLEYMRRKIAFPVVRKQSGTRKYISN